MMDYSPPLRFRVTAEYCGHVLLAATGPAPVVIVALAEVLATIPNHPRAPQELRVQVTPA